MPSGVCEEQQPGSDDAGDVTELADAVNDDFEGALQRRLHLRLVVRRQPCEEEDAAL